MQQRRPAEVLCVLGIRLDYGTQLLTLLLRA